MKRVILVCCLFISFVAQAQLSTDRLLSIGRNALYFEDYVLSIQYFNQVIKIKPFLAEPYFYRAVAKIQLEDYEGAENDLNALIERNPFIPAAFYARGFARRQLGRWPEAIEDFNKALEFSPANPTYIMNRIEAYEHEERFDDALNDLDYLIRRSPGIIEFSFEKGRLLLVKGDTVSALNQFDAMVMRDSTNADILGARAVVRLMMNNNEGALYDYDRAIALGSKQTSHYINRGILNYRRKNYRQALADYDKAIELEPRNEQARFNRSLLRSEVGDYDNALSDLDALLAMKPHYTEAIYQRALVHSEVGNWQNAIDDYTGIIEEHPTFVPAYYGRSKAYEMLGKRQKAYLDQEKAFQLMQANKNKPREQQDSISTDAQIAVSEESVIRRRASLFNANASENEKNSQGIRGLIQNREVNVVNERNFVLSYYRKSDSSLPGRLKQHPDLDAFNRSQDLSSKLYLVNDEVSLSSSMIQYHFNSIDHLSQLIDAEPNNANFFLRRAIDYALVQDYNNAINDLNKALFYGDESMAMAYFYRANVRFKYIEFMLNSPHEQVEEVATGTDSKRTTDNKPAALVVDKKYANDFEMIMRDYDKVIELFPDFPYSWYNRGNILCIQKDYNAAISSYTRAIAINPEFGEAYFNRGLAHLYLGEDQQGAADLSKAGELGIYQAYSILKKINEK